MYGKEWIEYQEAQQAGADSAYERGRRYGLKQAAQECDAVAKAMRFDPNVRSALSAAETLIRCPRP